MRRTLLSLLALLLGSALRVSAAAAQGGSGSVGVSATVGLPAVLRGLSDLAFGTVYPGTSKTVAPADAGAGVLQVLFGRGQHVNLSFALPAQLVGPGGATLPVDSWSGVWNTTNSPTGGTAFTPSGAATTVTMGTRNASYIFLGARVRAAAAQPAGTYSGTITVTGAYAGF